MRFSNRLRSKLLIASSSLLLPLATIPAHAVSAPDNPGCDGIDAKACVERAIQSMGGRDRLAALKSVRIDYIGHTELMEQSYRQSPFITSYLRNKATIDLAGNRLLNQEHVVWPESDPGTAESDVTLIAGPDGGVYQSGGPSGSKDSPCSISDIDATRQVLALGPERLLFTASNAPDLHFEAAESLRSTPHAVVGFTWNKIPVRVLLNASNHLPDAVETVQQLHDFWYFWGDVHQVIYWDNWTLNHGIRYPTNRIIERNGAIWNSIQVLSIEFNVPIDEKAFAMDKVAAAQSLKSGGWSSSFHGDNATDLAPGVTVFQGAWNTAIIRQPDGIVLLETPISSTYTEGIFAEAKKRYPGVPIKAVLSTSDSWPHVGGIRYDATQDAPIYILDLNQPLLDRMIAAPHTIDPDALEKSKHNPNWKIVSGKTEIGTGENRLVLYPLRGASTERQYMVYFPALRILYASDTMVVNQDHTLYDPELMHEVQQAVEREHLTVDKVYAMHEGPVAWADVLSMLKKAMA